MLTVRDALALDVLRGARLVAGEDGADKPIDWVHNMGVPDAYNWVNGGELVITTALTMPDDETGQIAYINRLAHKGVVGLAVAVGRYLDEIPPLWRDAANANGFPLIGIPYQTRFVDIVRVLNERITKERVAQLRRAMHINKVLSQLVLDGGGLQELAKVLADLIGQSVSIETERFDVLASENIAEIDEARRYTLEHGHTYPALIEELDQRGILKTLRDTRRPVQLPRIPSVGLGMERILAPIVVHGDIYGYIWIIADGDPLTDIEHMAIESGATIAALMLLHQEAVQTAEASLKGGLISQLIDGENGRESVLTDQALRYGMDLQRPYVMLLIDIMGPSAAGSMMRVYRRVNQLAQERDWAALVSQFAGQVVMLLSSSQDANSSAEFIMARLQPDKVRITISGLHQSPADVPHAYSECVETLAISGQLSPDTRVMRFDALGYLHTLYHAGADSLRGNALVPILWLLQAETQADLFHTLEVYLDLGGNGVATSEALHIHRSTLNYRLSKITDIIEIDLSDPTVRLNLQITIKQMRLFRYTSHGK